MSHPTHPATVHFPITTTVLTAGLDVGYFASTFGPTAAVVASAVKTLGIAIQPSMFPVLSYYTNILTILFSIPAVASGVPQLLPVLKRDGISSKKAQVGILHAAVNDLALFGAVYNWWTRREVPGFTPSGMNIFVSSIMAAPGTLFAAYLGGHLVYVYGMGFSRSSNAKKAQ